eukprot:535840-Prorocentrum_lima.AAC.1
MVTKIGARMLQTRMHKFFNHGAASVAQDPHSGHGTTCGTQITARSRWKDTANHQGDRLDGPPVADACLLYTSDAADDM